MGANGQLLQWHAKWEAVNGKQNVHKTSAKLSMGMMQGNSLELSYKLKSRKATWLDEYLPLPKSFEVTTALGRFPKIEAMANQEITTLASHPTLSFGFEHDIGLGCWSWIWELTYNSSTFRVPIPVLHLGTVTNPAVFYQQKLYYGLYCLMIQSLIVDVLHDEKEDKSHSAGGSESISKMIVDSTKAKSKQDAARQLKMMEDASERRRRAELKSDGLVILSALYFLEVRDGVEMQVASMNATTQLQFWVWNGRLSLPAFEKSTLLGFYDLRTEIKDLSRRRIWEWKIWKRLSRRSIAPEHTQNKPVLRVRYSFQGYVYETVVSDEESLHLPIGRARLLGRADIVQ